MFTRKFFFGVMHLLDYGNPYEKKGIASFVEVDKLDEIRNSFFKKTSENSFKERLDFILSVLTLSKNIEYDFTGGSVDIGKASDLSTSQSIDLDYALRFFMPWKKGPYKIFGRKIDSEWNSFFKWERIKSHLGDLKGLRVADIGCHSGYFMFKMVPLDPEVVIGFDPVAKLYYNFLFLQSFVRSKKLFFEPQGVESIKYFRAYFHRVLCLGLLYQRTDPVSTLRDIHRSLTKGGQIIVDCQGIEGSGSYCLFPEKKYAGAHGVWFLPTKECLVNWLKRSEFKRITCFYEENLSFDEQCATRWAPLASLEHYLNPKDLSRTVEGYPAPKRFYLKAYK